MADDKGGTAHAAHSDAIMALSAQTLALEHLLFCLIAEQDVDIARLSASFEESAFMVEAGFLSLPVEEAHMNLISQALQNVRENLEAIRNRSVAKKDSDGE